ncbi:hypothetical protein C1Y63_11750 [Corynebacterium sp. 13CS0277]|uniref:hypothetical protein n=1 Tax=Corynebacterium sp. 13CS0277 TaxID=2071994 RepID=UPI000D02F31F|nr:hypothetical protein [Corynebacterium sp. 13CS0277]PRQ10397.1 hypothetical protein C1Y63_11750 [Corynebacterium sp. 13CS0277]
MSDVPGALADCVATLRPGGQLFIIDLDHGQEFFHRHAHDATHADDHDGVHHHGFRREHIADLLRAASLDDVAVSDAYTGVKDGEGEAAHGEQPAEPQEYTLFLARGVKPA